jgi:hypothetical protein
VNIGPKIGEGLIAEIFLRENSWAVKLFRPGIPVQLAEAEWRAAQPVTRLGLPAPSAPLAEHVPEAEKQRLLLRVHTLLRWGPTD